MVNSKSWPFIEAQKIVQKLENTGKNEVIFETGYGPSGLPHIGTFGEVARTSMVINALKKISDVKPRLIAFSDDMDGLRKVPSNLPNQEMLLRNLGKPLTSIPDPYEKFDSFAGYMNNKLQSFLNQFGFDYEFRSATECYKAGMFDQALLTALKKFDQIMDVIIPTLGQERKETYSPFLPVCKRTGKVLQVPIIEKDIENGTITYKDPETNEIVTTLVTGGNCKMQWKADWAMRWYALDIDYEMHGKDLIPSEVLSSKICQIMGKKAPITFNYELFLDAQGKKISKSHGNGISIEEWLKYATQESLQLFMYQSPKKAKRLHYDVIPKNVDEYITFIRKYDSTSEEKFDNPVWHIHNGDVPNIDMHNLTFNLLLNLASACNPENKNILWGFIKKYAPEATAENSPFIDHLVNFAIEYYNDFIKPNKHYKVPSESEKELLNHIKKKLLAIDEVLDAQELQNIIYQAGKEFGCENLKDYFKILYQVLLGLEQGPRLGSFIKLFGVKNFIALIEEKLHSN